MLPKGFQQIHGLSICPIEWSVVQADEICSKITKGTTPSKSEIVENSNIPFLRVNNLTFQGKLNGNNELIFVTEFAHRGVLARSIAYPNDILMNIVGPPLGKVVLLPDTYLEYNLNQAIIIYRINPRDVDVIYFLGYLKSHYAQLWLSSRSKKTSGQQNLTIELCKELPVPLPSLPEQQKIAQILSTWDKAIEKLEALITAKQKRKKALMQQLLTGKVRFAGFDGEWRKTKIGDFSKLTAGGTPSTKIANYWGGEIPWMNSGDVHQRNIFFVAGRITKEGLNSSSTKLIPINSVLVALAGQGKTRGTVAINKIKLATNQSIAAIIPDNNLLNFHFLFYNLESRYEELRSLSFGDGGRGGLNLSILKDIQIDLPSKLEQQKIATVLSAADKEITNHQNQLAALKHQKQGLMQQLLTGKKRVKVNQVAA
ncbi:Type I restriction modification DNA specificity domain protein [Crenothrix polyspora]|uniref:Type I restriction modification DNA specificity domain protein n=1 Tax=Crenothrix polyspora TaxID=360316 RepID=A0A1R4HFV2_9GAMM|nr:restriction endonuclease subunit S [Crenothrix polyspora]SJM95118.1 Type I restriction modification DNA specificity domain protein [Crenothrix polyspora]